jgi:hypothetical protein
MTDNTYVAGSGWALGMALIIASFRQVIIKATRPTMIELRCDRLTLMLPGGRTINKRLDEVEGFGIWSTGRDALLRAMGALHIDLYRRSSVVLLQRHDRTEVSWLAALLDGKLQALKQRTTP